AELSYRLVENRFRAGRRVTFPRFEWGTGPYMQRAWARPAGVVGVGLLAIAIAGGLPMRSGLADQPTPDFAADTWTGGTAGSDMAAVPLATSTPDTRPTVEATPTATPSPVPVGTLTANDAPTPAPPLSPASVVAVPPRDDSTPAPTATAT